MAYIQELLEIYNSRNYKGIIALSECKDTMNVLNISVFVELYFKVKKSPFLSMYLSKMLFI